MRMNYQTLNLRSWAIMLVVVIGLVFMMPHEAHAQAQQSQQSPGPQASFTPHTSNTNGETDLTGDDIFKNVFDEIKNAATSWESVMKPTAFRLLA
jgi:hypothetical protein